MSRRRSLALAMLVVSAAFVVPTPESDVAARPVPPVIEDFRYDKLKTEGTAREVCAGRIRNGTQATFNEVRRRFGGFAGSMYVCRERWDVATNPDCNGTVVNPAASPNFHSTCWSTHAEGRAWDLMVGRVGSGYNRSRGIAVINWLLAPDSAGNVSARARRLGVQQILFADRCWNSDGDRGITTWHAMRECGIGHHDHIHVDMTLDGAVGNVSYWGAAPRRPAPKPDTMVLWDRQAGWRQAVSWWNLGATNEGGSGVGARYDRAIVGDWNGNGIEDDIFLWDIHSGSYVVQTWTNGRSSTVGRGAWTQGYDEIIAGDWDGDGRVDDMLIWDRQTGNYVLQSWHNFRPTYRGRGSWTRGYDKMYAGDFDGDGRRNDLLIWNRRTGTWVVQSFHGFRPRYRSTGTWTRGYDELIIGDWNAGGEYSGSLVWNQDSGLWVLQTWSSFQPTYVRSGYWSVGVDIAVASDLDADGRADDLFLYDDNTGRWKIVSFHRNVPSTRLTGEWLGGYDVISVGSFLN